MEAPEEWANVTNCMMGGPGSVEEPEITSNFRDFLDYVSEYLEKAISPLHHNE